jgi:hypothetical protein
MKLGSPANASRGDAEVDLQALADAVAAGAVRADAGLTVRSLAAAVTLAVAEAAGRRDAGLIEVPSRSPAIGLPVVTRSNLNLEAKGQ